jgi:hypothetical protein
MDEREQLIAEMNEMLNSKLEIDALVAELTRNLDEKIAELLN